MKLIKKEKEPSEWETYRNTPGVKYESKPYLRKALYKEQGGICAYCMQRLKNEFEIDKPSTNRIEHLKSRDNYPELQLDYRNMLLCCNGQAKEGKNDHVYCDRKKGNKEITISPLDSNFIESLSYHYKSGKIVSSYTNWQKELDDVLNLNDSLLKENRAYTFKGIYKILNSKGWKVSEFKSLINTTSVIQKVYTNLFVR